MFAGGALDEKRDYERGTGDRQDHGSQDVLSCANWRSLGANVVKEAGLRENLKSLVSQGFDLSRNTKIMTFVLDRCSERAIADARTVSDLEGSPDSEFLDGWPRNVKLCKRIPDTETSIGDFDFGTLVKQPHGNRNKDCQCKRSPFENSVNASDGADRNDRENEPHSNGKNSAKRWSDDFCRTHIFILTARSYLDARDALIRAAVCGRK